MEKVRKAQIKLRARELDGWLLYGLHEVNPLALNFLDLPKEIMISRRCFYWIPAKGNPVKIVHQIEEYHLDHLLGEKKVYANWRILHKHLQTLLKDTSKIAMEYSPMQAIPNVSKVDGGLIDLIRSFGPEIVSSASFLQEFTCVWTPDQYQLHKQAAHVLDQTVHFVWDQLCNALEKGKAINEYDLQQMILEKFIANNCITEGRPTCSVNANTADPHYDPIKDQCSFIQKGDLVLIDLWCKKDVPGAVFADITRMGVAGPKPTAKQQEIFSLVRKAQKLGTDWIAEQHKKGKEISGSEVDDQIRQVIEERGYGQFFTHRSGHNIDKQVHGPGANLDNFETKDDRLLIPNTCFSIEPGIYLKGEFGVRLEYDVFMHDEGTIEITTPPQDIFMCFKI